MGGGGFTAARLTVEHITNLKVHQSLNKQLDFQSRIRPSAVDVFRNKSWKISK